jgi:hypothetical protein
MLPLDKNHITKASQLMADITSCNSVARWNAELQAYEQYIVGIPPTDFDVKVGYPYYVNVSSNVFWPAVDSSSQSIAQISNLGLTSSNAPHAVWGKFDVVSSSLNINKIKFKAYITGRQEETLTKSSSGCLLNDGYFIVQCGSFSSPWSPGEVLRIVFEDNSGVYLAVYEIELTSGPSDEVKDILLSVESTSGLPRDFKLNQNYPNPFNPVTCIPYEVPKESYVRIIIYNMKGQEVVKLVDENKEGGRYEVAWDGRDNLGNLVSSNMYLVRMQAGPFNQSQKLTFIQ